MLLMLLLLLLEDDNKDDIKNILLEKIVFPLKDRNTLPKKQKAKEGLKSEL